MITPLIFNVGFWEITLIVLVVLLLFGGKKIPELMRGLGKGVKSFKEGMKDVEEEIAKLEAELAYQQKFLDSVRKKLSNERFVANAPEAVVAVERKKEADSLSKIESITASLNALKNN